MDKFLAWQRIAEAAQDSGIEALLAASKALIAAAGPDKPPPEVLERLGVIIGTNLAAYLEAKAETLDEAFGVSRPPNFDRAAAAKRSRIGLDAATAAKQLISEGWSVRNTGNRYAFAEVGRKYHVSAAWVRNAYYLCYPKRSKVST